MNTSISEIIRTAIDNTTRKEGLDYFKRPAGSYAPWLREFGAEEGDRTVGVLKELARDNVFVDVTEEIRKSGNGFGLCRYFRAPLVGGVEAACLLSELSDEQLAAVRVVKGQHGLELQAPGLMPRATDHLHLCVGSGENPFDAYTTDTAQVYFWAPGRVLPRFDGKTTTVKLGG